MPATREQSPSSSTPIRIFSGRTVIASPASSGPTIRMPSPSSSTATPFVRAAPAKLSRFEVPMKSATNGGRGALVERARGVDLLDDAAVHDRDPVGHRQRLLLVVGDVDEGGAGALLDPLQLELHLAAQLQVEGAERLVEQQRGGAVDQRAGEGDALALAAGELGRAAVLVAVEADHGRASRPPAS